MVEAMDTVKSDRLGVNRAAEEYNIPRTTLKDRLAGRVKPGTKSGPDPHLTLSKETELVTFLIDVCKMGHGKTKREVLDIVRRTVNKRKAKILENSNLMVRDSGKGLYRDIQSYLYAHLMPYHIVDLMLWTRKALITISVCYKGHWRITI